MNRERERDGASESEEEKYQKFNRQKERGSKKEGDEDCGMERKLEIVY
jgi:hypothetical protein